MEQNLIKCSSKDLVGQKQIVINSRFVIDSNNPIGKILAVYAKPSCKQSECISGKVNFTGSVCFKLVYLNEDGKTVASINNAEFTDEVICGDVSPRTYSDVAFKVVDVTTPSVKSNEVKVACLLDASIFAENCMELETKDCEDDIIIKKGEIKSYNARQHFSETFDYEEDFKINDEVDSVINVDYDICVKDIYTGTNYATISGYILFCVQYENEENTFKTYTESVPFKQDVTLDGVTKDSVVTASLFTLDGVTKTTVSQLEKGNEVKVSISYTITGTVYETEVVNNILDAYSVKNYIEFDKEITKVIDNITTTCFESTVREKVALDSNSNITLLGTLGSNVVLSNTYISDGKLMCEGVISTTLIYSYDENKEINSKIIEVPFVVEKEEDVTTNTTHNVRAYLSELDVDINSNGDAEINAKLCLSVTALTSLDREIICAVNTKGERAPRDYAIEILLGKQGETLWEVGKTLGVTLENLRAQNPNLPEVLEGGEKIVVYYGN